MHPNHTPRANIQRGVILAFYCRCGKVAVIDPASGKAKHMTESKDRVIRVEHIGEAING